MIQPKILIFGVLILKSSFCTEICKPKVAIIGGGIGGASASHFLSDLFKDNLKIDLFEQKQLGGRLSNVEIGGNEFEAGGAVIHPKNKYMQDFVKLLDLKKNDHEDSSTLGIWNGDKFVVKQSSWKWLSVAKLIYRYGFEPFTLDRLVTWVLDNFEKIYKLQDNEIAFENVTSLLAAMNADFPRYLTETIKSHLLNKGISEKLIDELVEATLVVNYGQETNVHSFVGFVSLAGAGANLWSVKGGNKLVPENLIRQNNRVNIIQSQVEKIRLILKNQDSIEYELSYRKEDDPNIITDVYDIVIIARPLTNDQETSIEFEEFPEEAIFTVPGKYQTTIATFVEGKLNPLHFGLESEIDCILSCNPNKTIVSSIGKVNSVNDNGKKGSSDVWKIFTRESMNPKFINKILSKVGQVDKIVWKAYPHYSTENRLDKFKLHKGLYHVNAIEWAASAMEMSAIGGRNVAILAYKDFKKTCSATQMKRTEKKKNYSTEF